MVLVGAGFVLVRVQRSQLVDRVDESNVQRMSEIVADLQHGRIDAVKELRGADVVAQVLDDDGGRMIAASQDLRGAAVLGGGTPVDGVRTIHDVPLESGDYRLITREVTTPDGHVTVLVAGSLDDVDQSTDVIRNSLLVGIPVVAALLALVVWILVGRLLGRVERAHGRTAAVRRRRVARAAHAARPHARRARGGRSASGHRR